MRFKQSKTKMKLIGKLKKKKKNVQLRKQQQLWLVRANQVEKHHQRVKIPLIVQALQKLI